MMNLVYNTAEDGIDADKWEKMLYAFLLTRYDGLLPYNDVPFQSVIALGIRDGFMDIVAQLGSDPEWIDLSWYYDAGPFKLYRSCIGITGTASSKILDVCQIDDDLIAVEAKLVMS